MVKKTSIVHVPRGGAGELVVGPKRGSKDRTIPPGSPAHAYIEGLAKSARPSMRSGLDVVAGILDRSKDAYTFPWHLLNAAMAGAVMSRLNEKYAPRSVNRMIAAVRGVLVAAWEMDLIDTDARARLFSKLEMRSVSALPPAGRTLDIEEVQALIDAARARGDARGARDAALVTVLYAAGIRRVEACGIDVGHYDGGKDEAAIDVTGKGSRQRFVYLASSYRGGFEPWLEQRRAAGKTAPVFTRFHRSKCTGSRLGLVGLNHALWDLRREAKVDHFTPHDLRRSFGTHMLDSGADILMVQKLMGHAQLSTTAIYDRRGEVGKRKAVSFLPKINFR